MSSVIFSMFNLCSPNAALKPLVSRVMGFLILLAVALSSPLVLASEVIGQLMFVHGNVTLVRAEERISAKKGDDVFRKDRIITASASSVQIRFSDGGTMALRPNSELVLSDYLYDREHNANSGQTTNLIRGGLRSISGAIGRANPANVQYRTPVATIGIRGTIFQMFHYPKGGRFIPRGVRPGTYVKVERGAVAATTSRSRLIRAGQALYMQSTDQPPVSYPADAPLFNTDFQPEPDNSGRNDPDSSNSDEGASSVGSSNGDQDNISNNPSDDLAPNTSISNTNDPLGSDPDSNGGSNLIGEGGLFDDLSEETSASERLCQQEGYESCAAKDNFSAAEAVCQDEGYESCAEKDSVLAAEAACRNEGFENCAAKDSFLAAEAVCLDEGYESCAAKDAFWAAEEECKQQGYSSCAAKDVSQAAEAICQRQGFESCAAKKSYLASEAVCKAAGYSSCSEMNSDTGYSEAAEINCSALGYDSCDAMKDSAYLAVNPVLNGQVLIALSDNQDQLRVGGEETYWVDNSLSATKSAPLLVGVDVGGARLQSETVATMDGASLDTSGLNRAIQHPLTNTRWYLGYWPQGHYQVLDSTSLEQQDIPAADLVYAGASDSNMSVSSIDAVLSAETQRIGFELVADTSDSKPLFGSMSLTDFFIDYDKQDGLLYGEAFFENGSSEQLWLSTPVGTSIQGFLDEGMDFSEGYYDYNGQTEDSEGIFIGGFSGAGGDVDGIFGALSVSVPGLSKFDVVGLAGLLVGYEDVVMPSGLLGLPQDLGGNPGLSDYYCDGGYECSFNFQPLSLSSVSGMTGGYIQADLGAGALASFFGEYETIRGTWIVWGTWDAANYSIFDYRTGTTDTLTSGDLGAMRFIFSEDSPFFTDIAALPSFYQNNKLDYHFVSGGVISDAATGEQIAYMVDPASRLSFDFSAQTLDADLLLSGLSVTETLSSGVVSFADAGLSIDGLNYLPLSGSGQQTLQSGYLSGRFVGAESEAFVFFIEALDSSSISYRGTGVLEYAPRPWAGFLGIPEEFLASNSLSTGMAHVNCGAGVVCADGGAPIAFESQGTNPNLLPDKLFAYQGGTAAMPSSYTLETSSEKVYWGYWTESDYTVSQLDSNGDIVGSSAVSSSDIGLLPYAYSDALPEIGSWDQLYGYINQNYELTYSLKAGGDIMDANASTIASLSAVDSSVVLNTLDSTMAINLGFVKDGSPVGGLVGYSDSLPSIMGFDAIMLSPAETQLNELTGGNVAGRFFGSEANGLMLFIETEGTNLTGRGIGIMELMNSGP